MISTKEAVEKLVQELRQDESYWITWQANIAMAFKDEWQKTYDELGHPSTRLHIHNIANKAAENFLDNLTREVV